MNILKNNTFTGHKDCIYSLLLLPNSDSFLSVAGDGMLVRWRFNNPEEGELVAKLPSSIFAISNSPIQNQVIIGQNFEGIHLIDIELKKEVKSLKLTQSYIFDIAFFENIIIVACGDGNVFMIDFFEFKIIKNLQFSTKSARAISINSNKNEFAVGYSDNYIRVFCLKDLALKNEILAHSNSVFGLCYSPGFKYIVSTSRDAHIKLWDCENQYFLSNDIVGHLYAINHISYSPDGIYFITCSMDKSIKIWDAITNKLLKVIDKSRYAGHGTSINKLLWVDNQTFLSCSDDRQITEWKIQF